MDYDRMVSEWGWNPEVFFGLMWPHVQRGQSLLDIGIGTGLSAEPFRKAGMTVHGFDRSTEMLAACARKDIAADLKRHDITKLPWPYQVESFDLALCGGLLHLFGDLLPYLSEAARVMKLGGVAGFAVSRAAPGEVSDPLVGYAKVYDEAGGIDVYKHTDEYALRVFREVGFDLLKRLVFLAFVSPETGAEQFYTLYLVRRAR